MSEGACACGMCACVPVCMCVCESVCVCAHVCPYACGNQKSILDVIPQEPPPCFEIKSLTGTWGSPVVQGWLAREPCRVLCLWVPALRFYAHTAIHEHQTQDIVFAQPMPYLLSCHYSSWFLMKGTKSLGERQSFSMRARNTGYLQAELQSPFLTLYPNQKVLQTLT